MMQYLSVHDLVWINSTLLGATVSFDWEKLEAAMASQYGYGDSTDTARQAANLLHSLAVAAPFERGNARTAFVAVSTFLSANRFSLKVDDSTAARIVREVSGGKTSASDAVEALAEPAETALRPGATLRTVVTHVCNAHSDALKALAEGDD